MCPLSQTIADTLLGILYVSDKTTNGGHKPMFAIVVDIPAISSRYVRSALPHAPVQQDARWRHDRGGRVAGGRYDRVTADASVARGAQSLARRERDTASRGRRACSPSPEGGQVLSQHIEPFTCNVTPERDHVIVAPRGELDMATVGIARAGVAPAPRVRLHTDRPGPGRPVVHGLLRPSPGHEVDGGRVARRVHVRAGARATRRAADLRARRGDRRAAVQDSSGLSGVRAAARARARGAARGR